MRVRNNSTATILFDYDVGHEYEVVVRAIGPDGTNQAMEASVRNSIVIVGKTNAPDIATSLTATGIINAVSLEWTNPSNYDLGRTEIWRSSSNDRANATKVAEVKGGAFIDVLSGPDLTRYYWIRAVNTSGVASTFHPNTTVGVSATSKGVEATDIDDFSITATKMFTNAIIVDLDVWSNNSPGAGSIAWNAHRVIYNGASYPISAGDTALGYIYWTIGATAYSESATHPTLATTAFMIAINTAGIHTLVWNSSANMVIGSAFIMDLAVDKLVANAASTNEFVSNTAQIKDAVITNAKINDLSADKLTAGTIDATVISVTNLSATNITSGTLTGRTVQTAAAGARITMDGPNGKLEFNDGSDVQLYMGANAGDGYMTIGTGGNKTKFFGGQVDALVTDAIAGVFQRYTAGPVLVVYGYESMAKSAVFTVYGSGDVIIARHPNAADGGDLTLSNGSIIMSASETVDGVDVSHHTHTGAGTNGPKVTYANLDGIPDTFAPASHNNTAHSATYIEIGDVTSAISTHTALTTGIHGLGTASQEAVGYFATASHNHAATDITSGTLLVGRGGTGGTSFVNGKVVIYDSGSGGFMKSDSAGVTDTFLDGDDNTITVTNGLITGLT